MKKLFSLLSVLALLLGLCLPAGAANVQISNQALKVDGKPVDCQKYNIDDENYFKLRDLAMLLNGTAGQFSVTYDETAKAIRIGIGAAYTPVGGELEPGEDLSDTARLSPQKLFIDGKERSDLKAYNIGGEKGNNYFRLKDLSPALGFGVGYDIPSRTVLVTTGTGGAVAGTATAAGRLGKTEDAGREYLDRITFLGDSTTYGIGYYYRHGYTDLVPPSQVWTPKSGTMNLYSYDTTKLYINGQELLIADAAKKYQPDILIITLGVSGGVSSLDEEGFKADYRALVQSIREASPETKIILNSIYPVADSWELQNSINNKKINAANGWIEAMAEDLGLPFLYTFEALEVDGKLPESSQNGDGLHLTGEAFGKVMEYIRTHALE